MASRLNLCEKSGKSAPSEVIEELDRLRRDIALEQRRLSLERNYFQDNSTLVNFSPTAISDGDNLNHLQKQLKKLIDEKITPLDPTFQLGQRVEAIPFEEIKNLLDKDTAIVQWYITSEKFLTFIITHNSQQPDVWQSSKEDLEKLVRLANEYLRDYTNNKEEWRSRLTTRLRLLAKILHLDKILSLIPQSSQRLILIPHRFLHLFPLHALEGKRQKAESKLKSVSFNTECLLDLFSEGVSYAPSCQLLQLCQNQGKSKPKDKRFFAIQNPTLDLDYTDLEVATIRQQFYPNDYVLVQEYAKKLAIFPQDDNSRTIENEQLKSAQYAHFSCHGYFNFKSPLQSALLLADSCIDPPESIALISKEPNYYLPLQNQRALDLKQCLSLGDIFALNLNQCRLVTLSACETGLTDLRSFSDEYIGLPSGFLFSGSPNVVSSLWTVNDLSTALLMIQFYQNLHKNLSVTLALNQAQTWLRDATKNNLQVWVSHLKLAPELTKQIEETLDWFVADEKPFQEPKYWAAFCATGQ